MGARGVPHVSSTLGYKSRKQQLTRSISPPDLRHQRAFPGTFVGLLFFLAKVSFQLHCVFDMMRLRRLTFALSLRSVLSRKALLRIAAL